MGCTHSIPPEVTTTSNNTVPAPTTTTTTTVSNFKTNNSTDLSEYPLLHENEVVRNTYAINDWIEILLLNSQRQQQWMVGTIIFVERNWVLVFLEKLKLYEKLHVLRDKHRIRAIGDGLVVNLRQKANNRSSSSSSSSTSSSVCGSGSMPGSAKTIATASTTTNANIIQLQFQAKANAKHKTRKSNVFAFKQQLNKFGWELNRDVKYLLTKDNEIACIYKTVAYFTNNPLMASFSDFKCKFTHHLHEHSTKYSLLLHGWEDRLANDTLLVNDHLTVLSHYFSIHIRIFQFHCQANKKKSMKKVFDVGDGLFCLQLSFLCTSTAKHYRMIQHTTKYICNAVNKCIVDEDNDHNHNNLSENVSEDMDADADADNGNDHLSQKSNEHEIEIEVEIDNGHTITNDDNTICYRDWTVTQVLRWLDLIGHQRFQHNKYLPLKHGFSELDINGCNLCDINRLLLKSFSISDTAEQNIILDSISELQMEYNEYKAMDADDDDDGNASTKQAKTKTKTTVPLPPPPPSPRIIRGGRGRSASSNNRGCGARGRGRRRHRRKTRRRRRSRTLSMPTSVSSSSSSSSSASAHSHSHTDSHSRSNNSITAAAAAATADDIVVPLPTGVPTKMTRYQSISDFIPDEFLDPIHFEIMTDPVLSIVSGHTFERKSIEEWIRMNQCDPISQRPLSASELVSNRTLREAIERWVLENTTTTTAGGT